MEHKRRSELELTIAAEKERDSNEREIKRRKKVEVKREKENKRKKFEEQQSIALNSSLLLAEQEGWKVIETETLIPPPHFQKSMPNFTILHRHTFSNTIQLFNYLLPHDFWSYLTHFTELQRCTLIGKFLSDSITIDSRWREEISIAELRAYFGITWYWESRYTSYSYAYFYKLMKDSLSLIDPRRYGIISSCLLVPMIEFCRIWSSYQQKCWNPSDIIAADETIFEWLGNGNHSIVIPGKPHPSGLEVFILACFSDPTPNGRKKPFILGCFPHWGFPKPTPLDCV